MPPIPGAPARWRLGPADVLAAEGCARLFRNLTVPVVLVALEPHLVVSFARLWESDG
jgi:hypothetical protein